MGGLGHQQSAPFSLPSTAPGPGGIVCLRSVEVGDNPATAHQLPQFTALDQIFYMTVGLSRPPILHDAADQFRPFRQHGKDFRHLVGENTNRLLHQHMQPRL